MHSSTLDDKLNIFIIKSQRLTLTGLADLDLSALLKKVDHEVTDKGTGGFTAKLLIGHDIFLNGYLCLEQA
jgi:hypothetical protein